MTRAAEHRANERDFYMKILERWFACSDWTMERLIAEIEALPPDPHGIPHGCPETLLDAVHAAPINNHAKMAVMLAGQHMANTDKQSSVHRAEEGTGQLNLF